MGVSVLPFAGLIIQISKERPARSKVPLLAAIDRDKQQAISLSLVNWS